jgi:hypothetical protein
MKRIVKQSIWVIFINIFIGTIALGLVIGIVKYIIGETDLMSVFTIGILGTFIGFVMFGLIFLIPLLLLLFISSLIFVKNDSDISDIRTLLIIESLIVSVILIYMAIQFDFYLWIAFILIFGLSQYRRYIIIKKELKNAT